MSALRLKNKIDQPLYIKTGRIVVDISNVYSHSDGHLTGNIFISDTRAKVINIKGVWRINR